MMGIGSSQVRNCRSRTADVHKAQSAMEYLMTYGWAILIIAVVLAALFELGVFNGSNLSPQACIAQAGFVCRNPVYTSNGITFAFGQTTGRDYYGNWVFVASQGEALNSNGVPAGFSTNTAVQVGGPSDVLIPGQTVQVDFPANDFQTGNVPDNPTIGTPFAGYVWLGYCLNPCTSPTAYSKVATVTIKSTAGLSGPTSTSTTSTSTSSTSTIYTDPAFCSSCTGDIVFDGSMPSSGLTGDIVTTGNVVIESGATLYTNGFYIVAGGTFNNGNGGTVITGYIPSSGGAALSGGSDSTGNPGTNYPNSFGGGGGGGGGSNMCCSVFSQNNGGNGGYTANSLDFGAGGQTSVYGCPNFCGEPGTSTAMPSMTRSDILTWTASMDTYLVGAGGGSGGTNQWYTSDSAAGGNGAYGVYIQAHDLIVGNIYANGQNGAPNPTTGWAGSGGGGGGVILLAAYSSAEYTPGTEEVNGGSGGAAGQTYNWGGNGGNGNAPPVFYYGSNTPITP